MRLTKEWLLECTNMDVVVGAGTVLAARWHHRHITDIDLFYDWLKTREFHLDGRGNQWYNLSLDKFRLEEITNFNVFGNGASWNSVYGPVSVFGTARYADHFGPCEDIEDATEIPCEPTGEILYKKISARIASESRYLVRDLYDIVVANILDPEQLSLAISYLEESELDSIRNDFGRGMLRITDFDKLIDPSSATLGESQDLLEKIAGEILVQDVTLETKELLNHIKQTELADPTSDESH